MLVRPEYHFMPAANWMNDPNGTFYEGGVYHLFYQYNPYGSEWGNVCWAYAESKDLVNWTRKGIKLAPEKEKGEQYCYSGCVVPDGDRRLMVYTSIGFEPWAAQQHARQRFAWANADFTSVERLYDKDMDEKSQPFPVHEWRDPFVFRYNGVPYLLVAGECWLVDHREYAIILYRAKEGSLTDWEFVSVLHTEKLLIECPNMIIENGRAALIFSLARENSVRYVSGDFDGSRLWERNRGEVDCSRNCFYASNISGSADGGYILYGWLRENLEGGAAPDGLYSGCLAMPRLISIDEDYRLRLRPHPGFCSLHERELVPEGGEVVSDATKAHISFSTEGNVRVRITDGEREHITLRIRGGEAVVGMVSRYPGAVETEQRARIDGNKHNVEIFLDNSVTEIFIDDVATISLRMYRREKPERLVSVKEGHVRGIRAFTMRAAEIKGE